MKDMEIYMNIVDFLVVLFIYQGVNVILKFNKFDFVFDNIKVMIDDFRLELIDVVEDIEVFYKEVLVVNDFWIFEEVDGVFVKNICGWIFWYIYDFDDFVFDFFVSFWIVVYLDVIGFEGFSEIC